GYCDVCNLQQESLWFSSVSDNPISHLPIISTLESLISLSIQPQVVKLVTTELQVVLVVVVEAEAKSPVVCPLQELAVAMSLKVTRATHLPTPYRLPFLLFTY
ncbi:hypothetical protein Ccrd_001222, partial [Cynara cardunculus var. scolymus]